MSGVNTDSDDNRSRSIFRQVRETIGGKSRSRHRGDTRSASSSLTIVNNTRGSADNIDRQSLQTKLHSKKSTATSFSHRLSLLDQVKLHISKTRKYDLTKPSSYENDEYTHLSLPPMTSISVSYFLKKFFFFLR